MIGALSEKSGRLRHILGKVLPQPKNFNTAEKINCWMLRMKNDTNEIIDGIITRFWGELMGHYWESWCMIIIWSQIFFYSRAWNSFRSKLPVFGYRFVDRFTLQSKVFISLQNATLKNLHTSFSTDFLLFLTFSWELLGQ